MATVKHRATIETMRSQYTDLLLDRQRVEAERDALRSKLDHAIKHYGWLYDQFDLTVEDHGEAGAKAMMDKWRPREGGEVCRCAIEVSA